MLGLPNMRGALPFGIRSGYSQPMRKLWAVLVVVGVLSAVGATPAEARSHKPDGVPTGMWIDFCDHTIDLSATLGVIADDSKTPTSFVDGQLTRIERALRGDASKITPKNSRFGKQILGLAKAVAKTRAGWDSTGQLNLRAISIAVDPMPACS